MQQSGPSEADVLFGRACLSFGLVTREQLTLCVADQRRLRAEGRGNYTLAQIMIGRKIISADVYRQVVARIRQHFAQRRTQRPPAVPPDITASGRYADVPTALGVTSPQGSPKLPPGLSTEPVGPARPANWGESIKHSREDLEEAARTWDDASSVVEADYEVVREPLDDSVSEPILVAPQQTVADPRQVQRERRDSGIRRLLGVPDDQKEFDFGPYRILDEVAAGGMGVIYRARASDTGTVYALKALINVENANDKQLRRFIQEAQSAMRLDHPGIVRIHDIGLCEGIPYFTMDLIEGQDLQHHLRQRSLAREEMLAMVAKVSDAVHYAHEHAVIHRDLKPANIIVRDADHEPILTDFGLAKNLDSSFKLTAEGAMVGTPLFLSPEQVSGKGAEVDRRCDVYGLGVMLYQILTGRLPFLGRNPYEVYRKVLDEDPTPPTQVDPSVPPELEKICLMALAKQKEERYPTAQALGEDIRRYLAGEPVQARLPTPVSVTKARRGKDPTGSSTGPRAPTASAAGSRLPWVGIALLALLVLCGAAAAVFLWLEP
ncbi:MAG: serine/threonine protein kinase [Planctomycetota bacterium]|nr:MAG: serine/threonine protein kinase [Planctomycetota bacterium]